MKRHIDLRRLLALSTSAIVTASVGSTTVFAPTMSLPVRTATIGPVGSWKFACRPLDVYDQHFYPSAAGMVNDSTLYTTYIRLPFLC